MMWVELLRAWLAVISIAVWEKRQAMWLDP
jgi:hypothetical protein